MKLYKLTTGTWVNPAAVIAIETKEAFTLLGRSPLQDRVVITVGNPQKDVEKLTIPCESLEEAEEMADNLADEINRISES